MAELKKNLQQMNKDIEEITDHFYRKQDKEGYDKLNQNIPKIMGVIEEIMVFASKNKNIQIDENAILNALNKAMNAMEQKDTVLIADILKYELSEQFNNIINLH